MTVEIALTLLLAILVATTLVSGIVAFNLALDGEYIAVITTGVAIVCGYLIIQLVEILKGFGA